MAKHGRKDLGIENVPQARYGEEEQEEDEVEYEKYDGDDLKPMSVVRQLMEQNGYDSCAHRYDEPSAPCWLYQSTTKDI